MCRNKWSNYNTDLAWKQWPPRGYRQPWPWSGLPNHVVQKARGAFHEPILGTRGALLCRSAEICGDLGSLVGKIMHIQIHRHSYPSVLNVKVKTNNNKVFFTDELPNSYIYTLFGVTSSLSLPSPCSVNIKANLLLFTPAATIYQILTKCLQFIWGEQISDIFQI